MTWDG
ncbi:hypothetical protein AB3S75_002880 [Citrus x aurantiifolia]